MKTLVLAGFLAAGSIHSQTLGEPKTVYIAPMIGNLDGFIAAEIFKQHVPMTVTTDETHAEMILTGLSLHEDDHWYNVAFNRGKDKNEGNVRLIDVRTKTMIWSGEAGDRSLFFSGWRRGGQRKVADRIVHHMMHDTFTPHPLNFR